jgi:hypothetical protein
MSVYIVISIDQQLGIEHGTATVNGDATMTAASHLSLPQ